jgi:hypothetical protein
MNRKTLMQAVYDSATEKRIGLRALCVKAGVSPTVAYRFTKDNRAPMLPTIAKLERELAKKASVDEIIAAILPQWQDISTAPKDGKVYGGRWDGREWVQAVVKSPPSPPFTHWASLIPVPPQ